MGWLGDEGVEREGDRSEGRKLFFLIPIFEIFIFSTIGLFKRIFGIILLQHEDKMMQGRVFL